jgi:ubiquinone/menaquinone biosynthesis C-methylase UbiE
MPSTLSGEEKTDMALLTRWLTHLRLSSLRRHLGRTVLDVGCGHGEICDYLPPHTEKIIFLDSSPLRKEKVNKKIQGKKIPHQFIVADISQLPPGLPPDSFDTVVMAAVLEHLELPQHALENIYTLLAPHGQLLLTTPTAWGGWLHRLGSHLGLTTREAAREHHQFYNRAALCSLFEQNGFMLEKYQRFLFGFNQFAIGRKPARNACSHQL